jgi:hypothetical protein
MRDQTMLRMFVTRSWEWQLVWRCRHVKFQEAQAKPEAAPSQINNPIEIENPT